MVKKIVGFDENGKKLFEREARAYDKGLATTVLGISVGDIVKTVPVIFLCGIIYAGQQNFNQQIMKSTSENSAAISRLDITLVNINNYLSASTGKQFKDGRPLIGG